MSPQVIQTPTNPLIGKILHNIRLQVRILANGLGRMEFFSTHFNTPFGRYRFLCPPLWIVSTDDVFISHVDNLSEGYLGTYLVLDGLKVQRKTELDHDIDVLETCKTAYRSGLRFNPVSVS